MKLTFSLLLSLACLLADVCAQQLKPNEFFTGAAEIKINPAEGSYLAGYGPNRRCTGIHDDLFVKAVVISNNENNVAVITLDCIGLPYPVVQRIREAVELKIPRMDVNPEQVVISSTHTHSGADVIGIWGENTGSTGIDSVYINLLIDASSDAIVKAWKNKQRSTARYAVTDFGGGWVENISAVGELDQQLSVLQFVNSKNKSIATLVNFACHPTILDKDNTLSSADYPAGIYRQLKSRLGGVNLFLQGAIGGWVQPEHVARNFESAEKQGKALADEVVKILQKPTPVSGNSIRFVSRAFEMPVSNTALKQLANAQVIKRDIAEGTLTEIAWFTIGEAGFATHPGETSPLYSLETKKLMTNKGPKFILGLGMDELGYILKPDFFQPGTSLHSAKYLTSMSPGPDAGPAMMEILKELSEDL